MALRALATVSFRRRPAAVALALILTLVFVLARPAVARAAGHSDELEFVLNTFSFLVWGALIMWMCAGFTMLESGSVRTKNASMICLKNIGIYSIAGLAFFFVGYSLMYGESVGGVIGSLDLMHGASDAEIALLDAVDAGDDAAIASATDALTSEAGYSSTSDWFFQMVFVATAASIVSGAVAERVKLWPFFFLTLVLTAVIYPVVGSWIWNGDGWLANLDFVDFAGSTVVHGTGGWAALAGVLVIGPRLGKYRSDGTARPTPPSNVLLVTLGVFILWFGWFGFNGGSQLALGTAADVVSMAQVLVNTNLAAAAGVVTALAISRPIFGRVDLFAGLNGSIAGLVAITAAPNFTNHLWAIIIGAIGALICTLGLKFLEKVRLDDVVGAIPAHLFAGAWGTVAASFTVGANFGVQLLGVLMVGVFVFPVSWVLWWGLHKLVHIRVEPEIERLGQDAGELGLESYPEFVLMPEEDYTD